MKKYKTPSRAVYQKRLYDYSGVLEREDTCAFLLEQAANSKQDINEYWKNMRAYYDGEHKIRSSNARFAKNANLPWLAAQSTDGYIHVETQIQPDVPDFQFNPRDKTDYDKAKQREKIVKFICDNNDLEYKNSRNERILNIYGTAVFKVCWDSGARFGCDRGDIKVDCPLLTEIYPDPASKDVDGCEYIGYSYRIHRSKATRLFEADFRARGITIDDCNDTKGLFGVFSKVNSESYDGDDDTVAVTEWWFRQPEDGSAQITFETDGAKRTYLYNWKAGDIALCIFINGKEVRYVPKYWKNTSFNGYPFVIYSKLPNENSIWGKSELEQIIPLIDAKDRELAFAQLNAAFSSNDIILAEENALCDGEELCNSPGAVWKLRPGMTGKVSRLGNGGYNQASLYSNSAYWQGLIESTTGNFQVNQGKEPSNVTTATGIALLNERAESRKNLKSADRTSGFKRLFLLMDMTALEYYNDGRIIRMGVTEDDEFVFRFGGYIKKTRDGSYIPGLDVTIHTGASLHNSKAFTLSAFSTLMSMNITADNYKIVKAYVETMGIPERNEICDFLEERFGNGQNEKINAQDIMAIIEKTESGEIQ